MVQVDKRPQVPGPDHLITSSIGKGAPSWTVPNVSEKTTGSGP